MKQFRQSGDRVIEKQDGKILGALMREMLIMFQITMCCMRAGPV